MKRIYIIGAVIGLFLLYGCIGSMDLEAQERAAEYKAEIIAAAKAEFKRQQEWDELLRNTDLLSLPIQAAK
jgi:hypothetical protein